MMPSIGDVLLVSKWQASGRDFLANCPPCWCVVSSISTDESINVVWLKGEPDVTHTPYIASTTVSLATEDEFEVVPEDEWPDEICVAMAKQALLSGVNEDD